MPLNITREQAYARGKTATDYGYPGYFIRVIASRSYAARLDFLAGRSSFS